MFDGLPWLKIISNHSQSHFYAWISIYSLKKKVGTNIPLVRNFPTSRFGGAQLTGSRCLHFPLRSLRENARSTKFWHQVWWKDGRLGAEKFFQRQGAGGFLQTFFVLVLSSRTRATQKRWENFQQLYGTPWWLRVMEMQLSHQDHLTRCNIFMLQVFAIGND